MFPKDGFILTKKPDKSLRIFLYAISVSKHLDLLSAENSPVERKKKREGQALVPSAFQNQPCTHTIINYPTFGTAAKVSNHHLRLALKEIWQ